jgi:hypothetical protein
MSTILTYETPEGSIAIEIDDPPAGTTYAIRGFTPATTGPGRHILEATESFESALGRMKAVANAFARTLGAIDLRPDSASVELALKFTGAAGVVFAKAEAEAQMKVSLTWKPGAAAKA